MKNSTVVSFAHVTKLFQLHQENTLKEFLPTLFGRSTAAKVTAISNASFTIERGQNIGIVGANGSGKSTLLKLIAGIIKPTEGKVAVHGKVSPLIELGAGFHPDLTGRENIVLNGLILGLTKQAIDQQMANIIRFAELERFIDSPVKHYSLGMYMRLGFSIAIHAKPEILLIDEVLAVGDERFRQKCLQVMRSFKKDRQITLIFVSHSLDLIKTFCDQSLYIHQGDVAMGPTSKMIRTYLKSITADAETLIGNELHKTLKRFGDKAAQITGIKPLKQAEYPIAVTVQYHFNKAISDPVFGITVRDTNNTDIAYVNTLSLRTKVKPRFAKHEDVSVSYFVGHELFRSTIPNEAIIAPAIADASGSHFYDWINDALRVHPNRKSTEKRTKITIG